MELTGTQRKQLQTVLLAAFSSPEDLAQMVQFGLETPLTTIAGEGPLENTVFTLIEWALDHDKLPALLHEAIAERSDNQALKDLAQGLENGGPAPRSDPTDPGSWTWKELAKRAQATTGLINPDDFRLYVTRGVEATLNDFLVSDDIGFILAGEPGTGKTMLLGHWALDLVNQGHIVLFNNSTQFQHVGLESQLAQVLGLAPTEDLFSILEQVQKAAPGRQLVLIFDAVDQFDMQANLGPKDLLIGIDQFVRQIESRNLYAVRVVLSCTQSAWTRLNKLGSVLLRWRNYYPQAACRPSVILGPYTPGEQETAYNRYKEVYPGLPEFADLSPTLCNLLTSPRIMRLMADSYHNQPWLWMGEDMPVNIYRSYYLSQVPDDAPVQTFLDNLAAEMRQQQSGSLSINRWRYHRPEALAWIDETNYSPYSYLVDTGVLLEESKNDDRWLVFSQKWMGAYALALAIQRTWQQNAATTQQMAQAIADLVQEADVFVLAWDAARILLTLTKNPDVFTGLMNATVAPAGAGQPLTQGIEVRELVAEGLVGLYIEDAASAEALIGALLMHPLEDAQHTALKAMYQIGANARNLYLRVITDDTRAGSAQLRSILHNTLYLNWQDDQQFVYYLLEDLIKAVEPADVLSDKTQKLIEFVIQLAAVIYMNHPEVPEVQQRIAGLYRSLAVTQLHLDTTPADTANTVFWGTLGRFLIAPTVTALLLEQVLPEQDLFTVPPQERAAIKTVVAPLLDPAAVLDEAALAQLTPLLNSELLLLNIMAAHVLPIHAAKQPVALLGPMRALFDTLELRGRMAVLFSFSLLMPQTPDEWIPLLEYFTRRLVEEKSADVFYGDSVEILNRFDTLLLPLGLAYAKAGEDMLYFQEVLRNHLQASEWTRLSRHLKGLTALGVYHPKAVFAMLERRIHKSRYSFQDPQIQNALLPLLATLHILHFDLVDDFLQRVGLDTNYARRVRIAAGVGQLPQFLDIVALYNQIVYHALHYPRLRDELSVKVLEMLADAPDEATFRAQCNTYIADLFKSTDYDMRQLLQ